MYGIDDVIRRAKTITPESEIEASEVFTHAQDKVLPVGYIVKAIVRCNQLDTFRMVACDWHIRLEMRREDVNAKALRELAAHLKHAHPYLGRHGRKRLLAATQTNLRDFGR